MDFKDYYSILGVSPQADNKEIKKAYQRLTKKNHPDLPVDSAGSGEHICSPAAFASGTKQSGGRGRSR